MSRLLLTSEIEVLIESGATTPREVLAIQPIWQEYHVPKMRRQRQWFNTDFFVDLAEPDLSVKSYSLGTPVRPFTMGAAYFVSFIGDRIPIKVHLLEGEMFAKSSFKEEIRRIDEVLESLIELPRKLSTKRAPYLRVARLSQSIAFLIASTTTITDVLPARPVYLPWADGSLEYRTAGDEILIDGVIRAGVASITW